MEVPRKLRNDLSATTLDAIAAAVKVAESRTSAEIVVHVVHNLLPFESPRRRAYRAFAALGIGGTQRRNGVLLFIVMKKRTFEIVADEGAHQKVGAKGWEEIALQISEGIHHEGFERGVCRGVVLLGEILESHFPRDESDRDELPDRPRVERD